MTAVVMTMHKDPHGTYWADSANAPGYTAIHRDPVALMELVNDADREGFLGEDVDLRWAPCGNPLGRVIAISQNWPVIRPVTPCACQS